jgi:hypothetical protein
MSYGYSVLDTRDLIEERDEFKSRLEVEETGEFGEIVREGLREAFPWLHTDVIYPPVGPALTEDEEDRLNMINEVVETVGSEAEYGVALIPTDDFRNYAEDFADEIGAVDSEANWPNNYIDWDRAADALSQDYSTVEFEGTYYYYRA